MKNQHQTETNLKVEKREQLGKKSRQLRRKGMLPANIYGPDIKSQAITIVLKDFMAAYKVARETGIVYLEGVGEKVPTLIKHIQLDPLSAIPLHVDFRKIDLKQKIETTVPIQVVGTSEAVAQKGGVLLHQHDHLTIEALPQDIPQHIEVDIAKLKEIGDEFTVADLPSDATFTVKDEPTIVIVSVVAHKEESTEAQTTAAAAPEVITEKAPAEGEEGAEAPAGEKAKEDKKE